jgi:hypothetical protein
MFCNQWLWEKFKYMSVMSATVTLNCPRLTNKGHRMPKITHSSTKSSTYATSCQKANMCRWHGRSSDRATCWTEWHNAVSENEQWGVLPLSSGCSRPRSSPRLTQHFPPKCPYLPTSRLHIAFNPTSVPENSTGGDPGFRSTLATKMFHRS